ncbi:MAG: hypothetical protein ABIE42_09180 [Candidatus Eisenbacteria bacterium]
MTEIEILAALEKRLRGSDGEAKRYIRDVLDLPPEVVRVDHLRWEATISTAGVVSLQAVDVAIPKGMDFVLRRIRGYIQEAAADQIPDNWARITFKAREEGRNFDVFTSLISMAELLATLGPAPDMVFDTGIYRFSGGHAIKGTFAVDTTATGPGAWTASVNQKVVGVVFTGDLVLHSGESRT